MTAFAIVSRNIVLASSLVLAGLSSGLAAGRQGGHAMHPQNSAADCGQTGEHCKKQDR